MLQMLERRYNRCNTWYEEESFGSFYSSTCKLLAYHYRSTEPLTILDLNNSGRD